MSLVRENINFERKGDLKKQIGVGKESNYSREKLLKKLEGEGIFFNPGREEISEEVHETFLKNIYEIEKAINKLKKFKIKIHSITGFFNSISLDIEAFKIINSKHVCVSEENAKNLIAAIKKLSIEDDDNLKIKKEEISINFDTVDWLNKHFENSKKFGKLLNANS